MKKIIIAAAIFLLGVSKIFSQPNDWENPQAVSKNSMEPHSHFITYPSEVDAINKKTSPFRLSLDGTWKFKLVANPDSRPGNFYKDEFDVSKWDNIKVPANWQTEGFDKFIFTDVEYPIAPNPPFVPKDYNPVGSYKRNFTVPDSWKDKNIFIHLGAVNSFFYLWINGSYVGFSKDSKTPAEFDITKFLRKGNNTVAVQVYRFSDGTYLEGQDMWKLSGIERSVVLFARPKLAIYDYFVKAGLDEAYQNGIFSLDIFFNQDPQIAKATASVEIKLMDDASTVLFQQAQKAAGRKIQFTTTIKEVKKWNAEQPHLYTLVIDHKDSRGRVVESISQKVGFRTVEVRNGLFLVNGNAIKIKGVNRHEHDMYTGKVVTMESMINDIRIFKQYNINAVRTSHYPNAEEWYELCDKYGIYVIDEANVECDGMDFHELKTLSDKPEWKAAYLDRTKRMFERDKNFCSIISWSLGNESRFGENLIATYQLLKEKDDTRPTHYNEAGDTPYTDFYAPMYKNLGFLQEYIKYWKPRPLILCEYAHMMGNGGGNLEDYWQLIYKYKQLQGGFVWDFSDQAFKKKDAKGRDIWAYGRDMGNVGATSDTSFCADGLFAADRSPHPQAFELKKVYQNIDFEAVPLVEKTIRIINRFDFTNLSQYSFTWFIKGNGKIVAEGKLGPVDIAPQQAKNFSLDIPPVNIEPGTEYFLTIEAFTKKAGELLPEHYIIAREQIQLPWYKERSSTTVKEFEPLQQVDEATVLKVYNKEHVVTFNKKTGWLEQVNFKGKDFLESSLQPHFWRSATDNDIGNSQQMRCEVWQHATEGARLDSFNVTRINSQQVRLKTQHYLPKVNARYFVQYIINAGGEVEISVKMKAGSASLPEMPRFGMKVLVKNEFDKVSWFGRGPFDNYWDRTAAADVDIYSMPADSLFHPYARAQESGYRTDIRWMNLKSKEGMGLQATGMPLISAGVLHFDMNKLEFDRHAAENNHGGSMTNDDFIWWNIDYKQMGVGGDNSWGARTHSEYMLPYGDYEYSFILSPVFEKNNP